MIDKNIHEKYLHDVAFKTVVNSLEHFLNQYEMTPSELRQAVMYACCRHEERTIRPFFVPKTTWYLTDKKDFDKENS